MEAPGPRILTAFEPFCGRPRNFSQQVLDAWPDPSVERFVLPVVFERVGPSLEPILARRPSALVLMGETRREKRVDVERIAINVIDSGKRADNAGARAAGGPIVPDGPVALEATWDADRVVEALKSTGVKAQKSYHAGAFACNQALYLALHHAREAGLSIPIGFLHLPGKAADAGGARARDLARRLAVVFDALTPAPTP